ncbi:hypothetical protein TSUD_113440 [Trifolium subterraneum]|uniref:Uncharacterized protein n=1 Tax=Trifolium subterraneum TaxID=3900 RepID=A0A2Z6LU23_TRISU|nr:hypothetical protein TSUD_113440 [Trifolium subterraneum]
MGEDILIGWLHLIAKVKIMTLSFSFLELLVNSLKVESYPWISDETVREMVTYLLQNSPPPATFVIGKVVVEKGVPDLFMSKSSYALGVFSNFGVLELKLKENTI